MHLAPRLGLCSDKTFSLPRSCNQLDSCGPLVIAIAACDGNIQCITLEKGRFHGVGATSTACRFRSLDLQRRRRRRFGVRPASSRLRLPASMLGAMLRHSQDPIFGRPQPSLCLFCPACCRVEAAETRELKEQSMKSAPKTPNPPWRLEFVLRFATSVTRCAETGKCHQRTRRSLSGREHVSSTLHSRCLLEAVQPTLTDACHSIGEALTTVQKS